MKNNDLTKSVFAALLLVSTVVSAEDKYPASDFKPTVVYQDESIAKETEKSSTSSSGSSASTSSSASDSQYPAANFEPKVLYSDAEYKHAESSPKANSSSSSVSTGGADVSASIETPAAQKEESSSAGYLLGLIVLGIAGFVFFKKGAGTGSTKRSAASSDVRSSGGLTGVARYVLRSSGTGVSRYLEKHTKTTASTTATGVAKYLASQVSSSKPSESKESTGVEKYLRNKG